MPAQKPLNRDRRLIGLGRVERHLHNALYVAVGRGDGVGRNTFIAAGAA